MILAGFMGSHEDGRRWVSILTPSAVLFAQNVMKEEQIARTQRGSQPQDAMEVASMCLTETLHVYYYENVGLGAQERADPPLGGPYNRPDRFGKVRLSYIGACVSATLFTTYLLSTPSYAGSKDLHAFASFRVPTLVRIV